MRLYKATIEAKSNFSTSLKGDTLFGQMCWAVRFTLGNDRLTTLLKNYETTPFLVVSDGFAQGYLPKPTMPSIYLNEDASTKKENRKKMWLTQEQLQKGDFHQALSDKEISNNDQTETIMRNAINYRTSSTGAEGFDPYGVSETDISSKDIYFLIDDSFSVDELKESLELVSQMGYGKDASIGKGRFDLSALVEVHWFESASSFMALSPFTPHQLACKEIFYEPFTRFGKSGANRANSNVFKKPIILANSGAVIHFEDKKKRPYIGKAISNISNYKDIVHQGYSILLPIREFSI